MTDKMTSLIKLIKLDTATFHGETVDPTYVNFFFGKNGAGKSTLANAFRHPECLDWATGVNPADYTILVYDQDFITRNLADYGDLKGVFTLSEENAETRKQIDDKTEERKTVVADGKQAAEDRDKKSGELKPLRDAFDDEPVLKVAEKPAKYEAKRTSIAQPSKPSYSSGSTYHPAYVPPTPVSMPAKKAVIKVDTSKIKAGTIVSHKAFGEGHVIGIDGAIVVVKFTDTIKYMTDNINKNISLHYLTVRSGLSRNYFRHLFKAQCGLNPKEYFIQLKLRYARELLCETNCKIQDIASYLGYSDQYTFSKQFKGHMGISPSKLRNNR